MKERPILFSTPMVRAILDGRKSQTRRIIRKQPHGAGEWVNIGERWYFPNVCPNVDIKCPYGRPGDILWVRETWFDAGYYFIYRADSTDEGFKWRPSIFMPREASRIKLEVTNVRVERLQEISHNDVWYEGVSNSPEYNCVAYYKDTWESINGKGSWEKNPWVWVIEFNKL